MLVVGSCAPHATAMVSVVVCTAGRRPAQLRACLASLRAQDDPHYEILVVDNGRTPTVAADEVLSAGCRVVREPRRGLDRARNRGVAEARGEFVAFIDDDCEAEPGWVRGVRAALADPSVAAVTGRVRPASLERATERWFETWFSFDRGPVAQRFDTVRRDVAPFPGAVGTGCNMAFRRVVFDRVGRFDEAIEMGTLVGGGGDIDMFARLLDAGEPVVYTPEAVVRHHHRPDEVQLRWQFWGYGIAFGALCCKFVLRRPGVRRDLAALVWRRLRYDHARRVRARLRGTTDMPASLVLLDAAGVIVGPAAYAIAVALEWVRARR